MDDGSQSEKAATFKKFKGRINNLLAAWKKEAGTSSTPGDESVYINEASGPVK